GGEVQVHQLRGEARGGPEARQLPPRPGAVAGLLLELAPGGFVPVLAPPRLLVTVEGPGRDLEEDAAGRQPELTDEQDPVGLFDREDRDRAGGPGDLAPRA